MDAKRPVMFRLCCGGRRRGLGGNPLGNPPEDHGSGLLNCFQTLAQEISVSMPKLDVVLDAVAF